MREKINFLLINVAVLSLIIFLLTKTSSLWENLFGVIGKIVFPFLVAFTIAFAFEPLKKQLIRFGIPKFIAVIFIIVLIVGTIAFVITLIIPLLFEQLGSLFMGIITFIKEVSYQYDADLGPFQETLATSFNDIIVSLGSYISNEAWHFLTISINYISVLVITLSATIYFLIDIERIKASLNTYFLKKSRKTYGFIVSLNDAMRSYLTGFLRIMLITLGEYTIAYLIIGHPNAILLGFLAAIGNLIPYFGGFIANCVAAITAFVISPALFIRTIIVFLICALIDAYVINPSVYKKSNELEPLIVIMAVFTGGILGGIWGVALSLPVVVMLMTTIKYYKEDIKAQIKRK